MPTSRDLSFLFSGMHLLTGGLFKRPTEFHEGTHAYFPRPFFPFLGHIRIGRGALISSTESHEGTHAYFPRPFFPFFLGIFGLPGSTAPAVQSSSAPPRSFAA